MLLYQGLALFLRSYAKGSDDELVQNQLIFLKSFLNYKIMENALIRRLAAFSHKEKREMDVLDEYDVKNNYFWIKTALKSGF